VRRVKASGDTHVVSAISALVCSAETAGIFMSEYGQRQTRRRHAGDRPRAEKLVGSTPSQAFDSWRFFQP